MKKEKLVVSSTGVDFKSVANLRIRKTRAEPKDICLLSSVGRASGC